VVHRGAGWPTVKAHIGGLQFFEREHGYKTDRIGGSGDRNGDSPASNTLRDTIHRLKSSHETESAWSFDVEKHVELVLDAVMHEKYPEDRPHKLKNTFSPLQRQLLRTAILVGLPLMARASTLTLYCPLTEFFEVPTRQEDYDLDGIPNKVYLRLTEDKTWDNKEGSQGLKLVIYRNRAKPTVCPVLSVLDWLEVRRRHTGGTRGPFFCNIAYDNDTLIPAEYLGEDTLERWLSKAFALAGFDDFTSHSLRHSAVAWAARCNGNLGDIMTSGRWVSVDSNGFVRYYQNGQHISREYVRGNDGKDVDPIMLFWIWQPNYVGPTMDLPNPRKKSRRGERGRK